MLDGVAHSDSVMKMEKYRFWHVAVCAGGGGKGSVAFDIDGKAIITDFLPFLTYMLRNADYVKLSDKVIREGDFYAFCALPLLITIYGIDNLKTVTWSQTNRLLVELDKAGVTKKKSKANE